MVNKLLVVVDMQNDFVTGALRNEDAIKIIPNVIAEIKAAMDEHKIIIFTKDIHGNKEDYLKTEEGKHIPIHHCEDETEGAELIPEIKEVIKGYPWYSVFIKDTFGCEGLADYIYRNFIESLSKDLYNEGIIIGITEVEFIGVCTDICVISNVLLTKAIEHEIPLYVKESCCAGTSPEAHKAAIQIMKNCCVNII